MTTKFILRELKTNTATPLIIRLSWKRNSMKFSTGVKINPTYLLDDNSKNKDNRVSNRLANSDNLNDTINSKRKQIEDTFNRYFTKYGFEPQNTTDFRRYFDKELVRLANEVRFEEQKNIGLFEYFDKIIERTNNRLLAEGKVLNRNSISTSYRQTANVLKDFEKDFISYKLNFQLIDLDFYSDFVSYCNEIKVYSVNNTGKHLKNLKTIMKEALEEGIHTNIRFLSKHFKVLNEEVYNVYLTDSELEALYTADLGGKQEIVRDLFIVACYTALRISDFNRLRTDHITVYNTIKIRTTKTGNFVEIPLNQTLYDTLKKYDFEMPFVLEQTFRKLIKEICEEVGINSIQTYEKSKGGKKITISKPKFEMVSSHTGRRTFATKYYNEGLDTITIMAMTGHKSEKSFLKYIKTTPKEHAERMRMHYIKMGNHLKIVG